MPTQRSRHWCVAMLLLVPAVQGLSAELPADDAVKLISDRLEQNYEGSAETYILWDFDHFEDEDWEPSTKVFYPAHHVVAAYHVADPERQVWRDALIGHLSRADDTSRRPVMALGAATWALAKIGGLDSNTPVSRNRVRRSMCMPGKCSKRCGVRSSA